MLERITHLVIFVKPESEKVSRKGRRGRRGAENVEGFAPAGCCCAYLVSHEDTKAQRGRRMAAQPHFDPTV
jgi:hypothetical protein